MDDDHRQHDREPSLKVAESSRALEAERSRGIDPAAHAPRAGPVRIPDAEEAERSRLLFAASPLPMWLCDAETWRFVEVNDAALACYGYTHDEFLTKTLEDIVVEQELAEARALARVALTEGAVRVAGRRHRRKDGGVLDVEVVVHRLTVGGRESLLVVVLDVTEQRRLEAQLLQAQKMEAVGRLAGGIAHDFNNLLSVILSYTSLALEELRPDDPLRADLVEVEKAGKRANALTRQLLAFTRNQVVQPVVIDLSQVLRNMQRMIKRLLGEGVDLMLLVDKKVGAIFADPGQIEQVIMNLAINARDAMPEGGSLAVETADVDLDEGYAAMHHGVAPGPYVMLAFTDNGIGMDAATVARVFEPFFTTKSKEHGTGLGLSMVYGIVKQAGGHIWVYSEPNVGTTFKVYFPVTRRSVTATPSVLPARATLGGTETVLLVEDDETVRAIMRTILRKYGYQVLEATNGGEALLVCEQYRSSIHLLVTDVVMPRMNGRQLAERLTRLRPEMKVLYVSGYTDAAIVQHGMLDAGIAYLQKPITPDALALKVRAVLDA